MATYDKRHSISMIASAAVAGARLVSKTGAHATTSADVVAISEGAAVLGRSFSAITFFSGLVEAAEVIPDGSPVKPAADGTGRAAVGTDGDNCGWAVYGVSKAGAMASVHVVEGRGPVSGAWSVQNPPLPVHLPVLSPERHVGMAPVVAGGMTLTQVAGGERGAGMFRISVPINTTVTNQQVRITPPSPLQFPGTKPKVSARVHFRVRCSDWSRITRIYFNLYKDSGSSNYHLLKVLEGAASKQGMTEPTYRVAWNNKWRTIMESSDKKISVGTALGNTWDKDTRYFTVDSVGVQMTIAPHASEVFTFEIDRVYSPDWPVGFAVNILDGGYKSALDAMLPEFNKRGWKLGISGNRLDGGTYLKPPSANVYTRYPTPAELAAIGAMGHDIFMHGHAPSAPEGPSAMVPGTTSEADVYESLIAVRQELGVAMANAGASGNPGKNWHQWLQNKGGFAGSDMAGILKNVGIQGCRGNTSDAEFGVDPNTPGFTTDWETTPANATGSRLGGWVSHRGRFNRTYAEFAGNIDTNPTDRDTYAGSPQQKALQYAANCGDGYFTYTHDVVDINLAIGFPLGLDIGSKFVKDYIDDMADKVASGKILVLSPSQVDAMTYQRPGPVYLGWDGEWRNRSDNTIAF